MIPQKISPNEVESLEIPRNNDSEISESFSKNSPYQNFLLLNQLISQTPELEDHKLLLKFLFRFCTHKFDTTHENSSLSEEESKTILSRLIETIKTSIKSYTNEDQTEEIRFKFGESTEKNIKNKKKLQVIEALYSKNVRSVLKELIDELPDGKRENPFT